MNEQLKEDLKTLTTSGNIAFLPKAPLKNYALLKKALTKATGKYKSNTFIFPTDAQSIIHSLITGEVIDFKKEFQFFETPLPLADYMVNQIISLDQNASILEPSAGHGALIDALLRSRPNLKIDAIELSKLNFGILQKKHANINLIHGDFLSYNFDKKYDLILANPPFSKNQDIDHIKKMYSLLNDGGQLITISSNSWTFGSQKKQIDFKNFVEDYGRTEDLERGSFKSSGTMVSGQLITFYK